MDVTNKILSDITVYMKYAKYIPELNRRETWEELVTRNKNMHLKRYPELKDEIEDRYKFVYNKKVLPSMRSMQFAGKPIEISPNRVYNCAFLPIDHVDAFSETMFLLLGGTGVGYSVQKHHVEKLPPINKPYSKRRRRFLIGDSIEGWSDGIKVLMKSYIGDKRSSKIEFDFSDIRQKGARLVTSGGKAPGPQPLKECIVKITGILENKTDGESLTTTETHDIVCYIADAVLAGGIRRAALISLFSADDIEMISCKSGKWWEKNPQRGRANNSAVLIRHKITKQFFMDLWKRIELSGAGEPGIYLSNDKEWGTNPSLRKGTKVITTNGVYPIEELDGKEFEVKNLNGEISNAKCWLSGKNQKLYKLTLKDKTEYFSTKEHEWPVWDGVQYTKVNTPSIKVGSKLPFLRETKMFDGDLGTYNDGFLSGWIIGDGWVSNRKKHSEYGMIVSDKDDESNISERLISTIQENVPSFNGSFRRRLKPTFEDSEETMTQVLIETKTKEVSINNIQFDNYIKQFGIVDKNVGLPKAVWVNGSEEYRKGIIDGLFSSDGHISKSKKRVILTSKHRSLLSDVSELLGFYGIKTTIRHSTSTLNGKIFDRYDLRINENQSIKQFMNIFKLSVQYKQDELDNYNFNNTQDNNQVEVISVEETEIYEDVWDISVQDETHCFQLSKVVTGNCCEIALRPFQFCNLCEVNVSNIESQEDLNERVKAAAFIGTLQAGYTDFHYLREVWQQTTEKDALIGVSMTGIGSGVVLGYDLERAADVVKRENSRVARLIDINKSARCTTVKPAGCQIPSTVIRTNNGNISLFDIFKINGVNLDNHLDVYREWYDVKTDIKVFDENGNENLITKLFVNGFEESVKFTMEDDSIIECTPHHKFMMSDGNWKQAIDITEDDEWLYCEENILINHVV